MKANHGGYGITASVVDEHVPTQGKYGTRNAVHLTREIGLLLRTLPQSPVLHLPGRQTVDRQLTRSCSISLHMRPLKDQ